MFSTHTYDGSDINVYPTRSLLRRYGVGDGSTTFQVPDYKECALAGVGSNGTFITSTTQSHDTYTLGQFKDDQLQNHHHTYEALKEDVKDYGSGSSRTGITDNTTYNTSGIASGYRYGNVTRGKRIGIKYLIKGL